MRGFAGKPFHPPLTDIPIGAYTLAVTFDVISYLGKNQEWSHEFYRAATFCFVGGLIVSVFAALTGFFDWWRSTQKGTQARRTVNSHAWTMITVTVLVLINVTARLCTEYKTTHTPALLAIFSVVVVLLLAIGATIGGSVVFDYGFNVETAGDSPVWHVSEENILPGAQK
jgi:uncharacterized membrane protein